MTELFRYETDVDALSSPARVRAIDETGLTSVGTDERLDRLTRLVAQVSGAPIAMVTVVESSRQYFASEVGLPPELAARCETPLSQSFCQYVVVNGMPLIVDDAREHPFLSTHPGLLENGVVAYAGFPVRHPDGSLIGTVCAADPAPHAWTPAELTSLADLAAILEADVAQRVRRVRAERLHESMRGAVDAAEGTAVIGADAEGVVTFANQAVRELLGVEPAHLLGSALQDLTRWWHPVSGRSTPDGAEDWLLTDALGEQRVVSVRRTAVRRADGVVSGSVLVCDDVSARHRAERLLAETLRKQQAAVEQMKTLDRERAEFIATASHELRTPVASIIGYLELLGEGAAGPLTERQQDVLRRVERNGDRLLSLVQNLLTVSEMQAGEHHPAWRSVDVGAIATQAHEALAPQLIGRDLEVRLDVAPVPTIVRGDPTEIGRIVTNLLTNAVKYTLDGGRVALRVDRVQDRVRVVVSDSGIGIEPDEQARVFELFYRSHDAQQRAIQGSGLGLALVKRLVEAHDGELTLHSVPGKGTTITVELPAPH